MAKKIVITDPVKIRRIMIGFGLFILIGGILALTLGVWSGLETKKKNESCTETIAATVTDYETYAQYHKYKKSGGQRVSKDYSLVYEFEIDGVKYSGGDGDVGSSEQPYPVGTLIQVHYDPNDPDNNYFYDTSNIKMYAGIGMGALFIIIGILFISGKIGSK